MARTLGVAIFALAALVFAPAVEAHGYAGSGIATRDGVAYRLFLSRLAEQPNGTAPYGVIVTDFQLNPVFEVLFWAVDNFVADEEIPGPTYTNTAFYAESATPGVCFRIDGAQANLAIVAEGHLSDFEIRFGPDVGV